MVCLFSPTTVKGESIRLALTLAASCGYKVSHFDISTANLNTDLKEDLYGAQAPGYEYEEPGTVYKLSNLWIETISPKLESVFGHC